MNLQEMLDMMSAMEREIRSGYHLTLGGLIQTLENVPPEILVSFDWNDQSPRSLESYRGYYSDLAFEWGNHPITAGQVLTLCRYVLGMTLTGYKGGEFLMDATTPLWASEYGERSGLAIVDITTLFAGHDARIDRDAIVLRTKQID